MNERRDVLAGAVAGLAGGLVAAFVMSEFQTAVSAFNENRSSSGDMPANEKAAVEISENVFEHEMTKPAREQAGEAVHYAMGGVSGMIYGAASELAPISTVGAGLPFGTAVWLIADDVLVPALGLSKPVTEFPLSTHAYALGSHLVYGLTTDLVRRAVRQIL
jgi:putative membrane protein